MSCFEFSCLACGYSFEVYQSHTDPYPNCPDCHSEEIRKLISNFNFVVPSSPNRSVDCVVGADAERRWDFVHKRKKWRDQKRQEKRKELLDASSSNGSTDSTTKITPTTE